MRKSRWPFVSVIVVLILMIAVSCGSEDKNTDEEEQQAATKRESREKKRTTAEAETTDNPETVTEEDIMDFPDISISQPEIEFIDAEEYYRENGELLDSIDIHEQDAMLTEMEVCKLFAERGFTDCVITTSVDEDGNLIDTKEISDTSKEKHPVYEADYIGPDGNIWSLMVNSDKIFAIPVLYNFQSENAVTTCIAEDDTITSYDYSAKKFYTLVPSEEALIVKKTERIDVDALAGFTMEELEK